MSLTSSPPTSARSRPRGRWLLVLLPVVAVVAGVVWWAARLCRSALAAPPREVDRRLLLVQIRQGAGDPAGATAILDEILREQPGNVRAMFARGILYLDAGEPAKAVPLLREVFRTDQTR